MFLKGPDGVEATIIDGEGINASRLGEDNVIGIVAAWGAGYEHVVGKDKRCGRCRCSCGSWPWHGETSAWHCEDGEEKSKNDVKHCELKLWKRQCVYGNGKFTQVNDCGG